MPNSKPLPESISKDIYGQVEKNVELHIILEKVVQQMQYGQVTVNAEIKDGKIDISTLNIVINKRIRY